MNLIEESDHWLLTALPDMWQSFLICRSDSYRESLSLWQLKRNVPVLSQKHPTKKPCWQKAVVRGTVLWYQSILFASGWHLALCVVSNWLLSWLQGDDDDDDDDHVVSNWRLSWLQEWWWVWRGYRDPALCGRLRAACAGWADPGHLHRARGDHHPVHSPCYHTSCYQQSSVNKLGLAASTGELLDLRGEEEVTEEEELRKQKVQEFVAKLTPEQVALQQQRVQVRITITNILNEW